MKSKRINRKAKAKLGILVVFTLLTSLVLADDTFHFGGTRSTGMGGAGLALPVDVLQNQRLNVAFLAKNKKIGVQFPEVGVRTEGANFGDLHNILGSAGGAALSSRTLTNLYNDFGTHRVQADGQLNLGFVAENFSLNLEGAANVTSIPNAVLASGSPGAGAQLDAYGHGFYEVAVGAGTPLHLNSGELSVGTRLKTVSAYYAHKVAAMNGSTLSIQNGQEFGNSKNDTASRTGIGVDLGVLYEPNAVKNLYFGATVDNFVVPKVGFEQSLPFSSADSSFSNPFLTTTSVGAGYMAAKDILVATDLYDIFNHSGNRQLRMGAEVGLGSSITGRVGYNSLSGFTIGGSAFGYNLSLSGGLPLLLTRTIKF
jgi:F plasmid transfer operon, TraF, protein